MEKRHEPMVAVGGRIEDEDKSPTSLAIIDLFLPFKRASKVLDALAQKLSMAWSHFMPFVNEALIVLGSEHLITLRRSGIRSKEEVARRIWHKTNAILSARLDIVVPMVILANKNLSDTTKHILLHLSRPIAGMLTVIARLLNTLAPPTEAARSNPFAPGLSRGYTYVLFALFVIWKLLLSSTGRVLPSLVTFILILRFGLSKAISALARGLGSRIPKFNGPDSLKVVVTGSSAGKFSAVLPGFGAGRGEMGTNNLSRSAVVR